MGIARLGKHQKGAEEESIFAFESVVCCLGLGVLLIGWRSIGPISSVMTNKISVSATVAAVVIARTCQGSTKCRGAQIPGRRATEARYKWRTIRSFEGLQDTGRTREVWTCSEPRSPCREDRGDGLDPALHQSLRPQAGWAQSNKMPLRSCSSSSRGHGDLLSLSAASTSKSAISQPIKRPLSFRVAIRTSRSWLV